jgi:hypothetical protein
MAAITVTPGAVFQFVMAGLDPAIHVFVTKNRK